MATYCVSCHDGNLLGPRRRGAPSDHNFDTYNGVLATEIEHIDESAGIGPFAVNRTMPPSAPFPSDDERRRLSEWIACGAP